VCRRRLGTEEAAGHCTSGDGRKNNKISSWAVFLKQNKIQILKFSAKKFHQDIVVLIVT
jgi:hypothetical protein